VTASLARQKIAEDLLDPRRKSFAATRHSVTERLHVFGIRMSSANDKRVDPLKRVRSRTVVALVTTTTPG
jgi:hypothetical protein